MDDLLPFLFNFNTEHWVKVELNNKIVLLKYIPLSLREKINITNKYEFLDEENKNSALVMEFCSLMLKKAYKNESFNVDDIPRMDLSKIYFAFLEDIQKRKKEMEDFYEKNKTTSLVSSKKKVANKLDSLINIGNIAKECSMSLSEVSELDELTLFCLMVYMIEVNTRESNTYEQAKNGKK